MEKKYYEVVVRSVVEELYTVYAESEAEAEDLVNHGDSKVKHTIDVLEFEVVSVEEKKYLFD